MTRRIKCCLSAGILFLLLSQTAHAQNSPWERYLAAGNQATMYGRSAEAERMYRAALKEAELFGDEDERLVISLRSLALTLKVEGQSAEALAKLAESETLFRRLLKITAQSFGAEDRNVGFILSEIAEVNLAQGKTAEAETSYKQALEIQRKNLKRDGSFKNRSAYETAINNLATLYCAQGRYTEAKAIDKRVLPRCVDARQKKDLLAGYPKWSPQERVKLWLDAGGPDGSVDSVEMENELVVHGLDTVPYLALIVRQGKGYQRLGALRLLCKMDRFVPAERLPEGVPAQELFGGSQPVGILDSLMVVDGRRIGKEGIEVVRWAAEQTRHDDLRFHAREYSGLLEQDLRNLSFEDQVKQWRTSAAKCKDDPGMNDDCTLNDLLGHILIEKVPEALPPLIEMLERDSNSYVREQAMQLLVWMDRTSVRLRGTETGRRAIEAIRRALQRCNQKPAYDDRESCDDYWKSVSARVFDDRGAMSIDWMDLLEKIYGLRLKDKEIQTLSTEGRQFVAYLTKVDPYFPGWEFPHHAWGYMMHPRFKMKWARYYEQWKRFKASQNNTNPSAATQTQP